MLFWSVSSSVSPGGGMESMVVVWWALFSGCKSDGFSWRLMFLLVLVDKK